MEVGKTEVIELDADEVLAKISEMLLDENISDTEFRFRCDILIGMWVDGVDGLFDTLNHYIDKSE